jgi:hypothetical protein
VHPVPSTVSANPAGELVTVVVTAPPPELSSAPTVTNAPGALWFAYSVNTHSAPRATVETRSSSIDPA